MFVLIINSLFSFSQSQIKRKHHFSFTLHGSTQTIKFYAWKIEKEEENQHKQMNLIEWLKSLKLGEEVKMMKKDKINWIWEAFSKLDSVPMAKDRVSQSNCHWNVHHQQQWQTTRERRVPMRCTWRWWFIPKSSQPGAPQENTSFPFWCTKWRCSISISPIFLPFINFFILFLQK